MNLPVTFENTDSGKLNLSRTEDQLHLLSTWPESFTGTLENHTSKSALKADSLSVFQINVGKKCNQACTHCHVAASPLRSEMMSRKTAEKCIDIIRSVDSITTVDITGGAPEINENFTYIVEESVKAGKQVIDRCNLTILEEPGYEYLYNFLAANQVQIVASLPHFSASRTDKQRGRGVFDRSITALKKLNASGYGESLILNLVYNPSGIFLSAPQNELEREFKDALDRKYGIRFNQLFCINNMPISRFLESLVRKDNFEHYMTTLTNAFNPATVEGLMCRHQISVGYDGSIYDCDFNQMLEIKADPVQHIDHFNYEEFINRSIRVANHCFGCTAGSGSSCGGEIQS